MLGLARDAFQTGSVALFGEWGHEEIELLLSLINPGDTVLDIGANVGSMTLAFAAAVTPSGHVLAFEPQLYPCECLRANIIQNSLRHFVTPYRLAVGATDGEIQCPILNPYTVNNFGGCCLLDESAHTGEVETIPMVTIDSLELPACHLIKADVEGMEPYVLQGAFQTIAKFQPAIWVEQLDHVVGSKEALHQIFADHDYQAWHISTPIYSKDNVKRNRENPFVDVKGEPLVDTNILALPSNRRRPEWLKNFEPAKL